MTNNTLREEELRKEFLKEFSKSPHHDWLQDGLSAWAVWLWFRNKLADELSTQKKELVKELEKIEKVSSKDDFFVLGWNEAIKLVKSKTLNEK